MTRTSAFSPLHYRMIITAVENGLYYEHAAAKAGITPRTLFNWLRRGKEDRDNGINSLFSRFITDLEKAQVVDIQRNLKNIQKAGEKNWNASAWLLERRHGKKYGRDAALVEEMSQQVQELRQMFTKFIGKGITIESNTEQSGIEHDNKPADSGNGEGVL